MVLSLFVLRVFAFGFVFVCCLLCLLLFSVFRCFVVSLFVCSFPSCVRLCGVRSCFRFLSRRCLVLCAFVWVVSSLFGFVFLVVSRWCFGVCFVFRVVWCVFVSFVVVSSFRLFALVVGCFRCFPSLVRGFLQEVVENAPLNLELAFPILEI